MTEVTSFRPVRELTQTRFTASYADAGLLDQSDSALWKASLPVSLFAFAVFCGPSPRLPRFPEVSKLWFPGYFHFWFAYFHVSRALFTVSILYSNHDTGREASIKSGTKRRFQSRSINKIWYEATVLGAKYQRITVTPCCSSILIPSRQIFFCAFSSRSCTAPQLGHVQVLTPKSFTSVFLCPQQWQV